MQYPACPRCYSEDEVVRPWPGFRVLRAVWFAGLGVIICLSPILFSDIVVMIPMTVAFLFAGGPLLGYAKQQPTCRNCGLARPHPGWHETPCRPVRVQPAFDENQALQLSPSLQPLPVDESGVRPLPRPDERPR